MNCESANLEYSAIACGHIIDDLNVNSVTDAHTVISILKECKFHYPGALTYNTSISPHLNVVAVVQKLPILDHAILHMLRPFLKSGNWINKMDEYFDW